MKKVLVFLLACLASSAMFAQHYVPDYTGCPAMYTKLIGVLVIDGEEQSDVNLEIGAFDPDDVCRGTILGQVNPRTGRIIYQLRFKALEEGVEMHFKVYDNTNGVELDVVDNLGEVITYQGNYTYQWNGSNSGAMNPYEIAFVHTTAEGYTLHIDGFEEYTGEANGGYYLIASPVQDANPGEIAGMTEGEFDLYSFNQSVAEEWINYKAAEEGYNLVSGMGYLYAHETDIDLEFTGTPVEGDEFTVELNYDEAAPHFAGWNLVGNPFAEDDAYITKPFYTMNEVGDGYVSNAAGTAIAPMTGLFVVAEEGEDGLTFTKAPATKTMKLALNLVRNSNVVDRAIVTFGAGQQLPKFQLRSSSTKLYIPMDGEDYAVVSSAEMGEMPVNFKAETSGSYTLAVSSELSFNYLHLIDNKTGVDVDLLANPSYSFEAQTTDYASRFRLVFATGNSDDTFAFYSNGSFVISNEGEAVVQVMDVTGRMLSSEAISGSASINVDGAAGVYMIRLVNGDNVKVQKVVVK